MLVVGGSRETPGAVRLAGVAALRAGAGKLQIASGSDVAVALAIAMPEAKVVGLAVDKRGQIEILQWRGAEGRQQTDALLVGPGMDDCSATGRVAAKLLRATGATTILDAGALRAYRERTHRECHPDPASRRDGVDYRYVHQSTEPPCARSSRETLRERRR